MGPFASSPLGLISESAKQTVREKHKYREIEKFNEYNKQSVRHIKTISVSKNTQTKRHIKTDILKECTKV